MSGQCQVEHFTDRLIVDIVRCSFDETQHLICFTRDFLHLFVPLEITGDEHAQIFLTGRLVNRRVMH